MSFNEDSSEDDISSVEATPSDSRLGEEGLLPRGLILYMNKALRAGHILETRKVILVLAILWVPASLIMLVSDNIGL